MAKNIEHCLKSIAVSAEYMGCGTTTLMENLRKDFDGYLEVIPSGGVLRRGIARKWREFWQDNPDPDSPQKAFRAFESLAKDDNLMIPVIAHDDQNEEELKELDVAQKKYGDTPFWEKFIDQTTCKYLIEKNAIAEGKIAVAIPYIFPDEAQQFRKRTFRVLLLNRDENGQLNKRESAIRVLKRKLYNEETSYPKETKLEDIPTEKLVPLIDATLIATENRYLEHWKRFKKAHGIDPKIIDKAAKDPDVLAINTNRLDQEKIHLAILLGYVDKCPEATAILIGPICRQLDELTLQQEHQSVLEEIAREAPAVASAIRRFLEKTNEDQVKKRNSRIRNHRSITDQLPSQRESQA